MHTKCILALKKLVSALPSILSLHAWRDAGIVFLNLFGLVADPGVLGRIRIRLQSELSDSLKLKHSYNLF